MAAGREGLFLKLDYICAEHTLVPISTFNSLPNYQRLHLGCYGADGVCCDLVGGQAYQLPPVVLKGIRIV